MCVKQRKKGGEREVDFINNLFSLPNHLGVHKNDGQWTLCTDIEMCVQGCVWEEQRTKKVDSGTHVTT